MKKLLHYAACFLLLSTINYPLSTAHAQGTAFTYQGRLNDANGLATGTYDFTFTLFATNTTGVALAGPVTNAALAVSNGLFTTTINFGVGVFTGTNDWLGLAVRTNGAASFSTLSPRQSVTPTPYAIYATTAGTAATATTATTAGTATSATSATTATTANNFSGSLTGDVTGTQGATVVSSVGGVTAVNVAGGANVANAATSPNTANTIVRRDGSGSFSAGTITATLAGNATTATSATSATFAATANNFSGSLAGDVTGTQGATAVSTVGGVTAANVAGGATAANAATSANTANTIVQRDASGNFSAGTITATLAGNGGGLTNLNLTYASLPGAQSANSYDTIGGGVNNTNSPAYSFDTVGGGLFNTVSQGFATVGGGELNSATNYFSTIAGGGFNTASGQATSIGGGTGNAATAYSSTVAGGVNNQITASASYANIGGGLDNAVVNGVSVIGGGAYNTNNQAYAVVAGGEDNNIVGGSYFYGAIGGGYGNVVSNNYAMVPGGFFNKAFGQASFAAGSDAAALNNGSFVWADSTIGQFSDTAANQFAVRAAGGARFVTYGAGLTVDGTSVVINNQSGVTLNGTFNGNGNGLTNLNIPYTSLPGAQSVNFYNVIGGGQSNTSGPAFSYDTVGGGQGNTANQGYATVGGGSGNNATGNEATVGGGGGNTASGLSATVAGGDNNLAAAYNSTVSGGELNQITAPGSYSTIAGGQYNLITNRYATIGGGQYNTNNQQYGTIAGGQYNTLLGSGNSTSGGTIGGGIGNLVTNLATVPGGYYNRAYGQGSFAAGQLAAALYPGSFVWSDGTGVGFSDTATNQFSIRANGGARFVTTGAGMTIDGQSVMTAGGFLNAALLTNSIPLAALNPAEITNTATGVTLSGAFSGNGGGLTNLSLNNAANSVVAGGQSTFANGSLTVVVGGVDNTNNGNQSFIGGGANNGIQVGAYYAFIGSGGGNFIQSNSDASVIGGGYHNFIQTNSPGSVIAGGQFNDISTNVSFATIGGGFANTNGGNYATIPGGYENVANGQYSFAAGHFAQALHAGSFVWADSQAGTFASSTNDQFDIRAQGGVGIGTAPLEGSLTINTNVYLDDHPIYFRGHGGIDHNHGLAYNGAGVTNFPDGAVLPDGPVLWGYSGGALGVMNGGAQAALSWNNSGVTVSNALNVGGNLTANNTPGVSYSQPPASTPLTYNITSVLATCTNARPASGYFVIQASGLFSAQGPINVTINDVTGAKVQLFEAVVPISNNSVDQSVSLSWVVPVTASSSPQIFDLEADPYSAPGSYSAVQVSLAVMYFPRLNN